MPFVPLAFVDALLLVILLLAMLRRDGAAAANRPFLALLGACVGQSILLGLRWGYDVESVRFALPIGAALLPSLIYVCFGSLTLDATFRMAMLPHLAPTLTIALLVWLWRPPIDAALIAIDVGYAMALLALARRGSDALQQARLDVASSASRSLLIAALALLVSAVVDAAVALDVQRAQGAHAGTIVSIANLAGLLMLGLAAMAAGRSQPAAEALGLTNLAPTPVTDDRLILARLDELMKTHGLYRSETLNLDRLARKAGIPARQISAAVNRHTGRNVSQYVNGHRIAEACRLLRETDLPLTRIMFEVGFQTKSNFNREFRRVTGKSPTGWREQADLPQSRPGRDPG